MRYPILDLLNAVLPATEAETRKRRAQKQEGTVKMMTSWTNPVQRISCLEMERVS